jgi:hypothetical protein
MSIRISPFLIPPVMGVALTKWWDGDALQRVPGIGRPGSGLPAPIASDEEG